MPLDIANHPISLLLFGWFTGLFTGILGVLINQGKFKEK